MSVWQHKGFDISLDGAQFAVQIDNRRVRSSSLAAAKKAIDKHLEKKAMEVGLNLPVLLVYERNGDVKRGVITGLDTVSLEVMGENVDGCKGYGRATVMPDSEDNVQIFRAYIAAKHAYESAKDAFDERTVSVHFTPFGSRKDTYAGAIQELQARYAAASKQ